MDNSLQYKKFIASKRRVVNGTGFDVDDSQLNAKLMDWQKRIVKWAIRRGRSALFEDCGMGKTFQQLEWARIVSNETSMPVVIHCPVGVRQQTKREAEKFGIDCQIAVCDDAGDIVNGINLINYEKLHKFDGVTFGGVVLDESSILKGMNGKTRDLLCERYKDTRFRLACTATPAPNDHMELGNHAEFLGVCDANDMLNRFFYHDSGDTSRWVLMPHGQKDFWSWVAQWAVCIGRPSDIGGGDDGYDIPELRVTRHIVEADIIEAPSGFLFNVSGITATTIHEEKRMTCEARCQRAKSIVESGTGPCVIWCDTNYESDMLSELMPYAIEVRGDMKDIDKEGKLADFSAGKFNVLISKPSIAGMGMNWQHCNRMVFAGLSYSFEMYYQAIRRCWRFGQPKPVDVHIVLADTESAINSAIARKESDFDAMRCGMADAMRESRLDEFGLREGKREYRSTGSFSLPSFFSKGE